MSDIRTGSLIIAEAIVMAAAILQYSFPRFAVVQAGPTWVYRVDQRTGSVEVCKADKLTYKDTGYIKDSPYRLVCGPSSGPVR